MFKKLQVLFFYCLIFIPRIFSSYCNYYQPFPIHRFHFYALQYQHAWYMQQAVLASHRQGAPALSPACKAEKSFDISTFFGPSTKKTTSIHITAEKDRKNREISREILQDPIFQNTYNHLVDDEEKKLVAARKRALLVLAEADQEGFRILKKAGLKTSYLPISDQI